MNRKRLKNITYTPPVLSARERDYLLAGDVLNGDEDAWDLLCQDVFPWVVRGVRQADWAQAFTAWDYQDITGEALARCYEQLERYQGRSRFRRWVLGYAKNILLCRRQRLLTQQRNRYLLERMAAERARCRDPLQLLLCLERDQCLWEAFSRLDATDRTIVYHRVFFQTAFKTLAERCQLTQR